MIRIRPFVGGALTFLLLSCASSGGMGSDMSSTVRQNLGNFSATDIQRRTSEIFMRLSYQIDNQVGPPSIVIETLWKARTPFDDEIAAGNRQAQTRIIIRGRQRRGVTQATLYTTTFEAQNRVRDSATNEWIEIPATESFRAYAMQMARELRLELESLQRH